jgi:hypothetical protein
VKAKKSKIKGLVSGEGLLRERDRERDRERETRSQKRKRSEKEWPH